MTDEPNNPIDQPSETPAPVAAEPHVDEAPAAPSSASASETGVTAETAQAGLPPEQAVGSTEAAETPAEAVVAETSAEPEAAETPAEAEAPQEGTEAPAEAEAVEKPAEAPAPETAETPPEPETPETPPEPETAEAPPEAEAVATPVAAEVAEKPDEAAPCAEPAGEAAPSEETTGREQEAAEGQEEAAEGEEQEEKSEKMDWYILKVQSNREDSIREGLLRRVAIAGLEQYFGQIIVPMEQVTEFKAGKKRVIKRKLYPGYLVVQMEINEDTWFLVRETPGIGDFTGAAGHPTPMLPHEVNRILAKQEEKGEEAPKLKIAFRAGDRVKINEGTFENFEGEVHTIDEHTGRVIVMIEIFQRSTPVELEYWQIESID